MALEATASVDIGATPQEVLEFVLDLERYRLVDHKILRVGSVVGPDADGNGHANIWGRLRFTPPAPDRHNFTLVPWTSLVFTGAPRQPGRLVFDFTGTFECVATETGTRLTHGYRFAFKGPFRPLERIHSRWLQDELEIELAAIEQQLP